jgi:gamma-glutamylcyclotransferase (GGCT)/AIG2-like uncharacterized protein YtfP
MEPHLFVYGTLRRATGSKWSRYLASASSPVGTGRVRGVLFQLNGYPGMAVATTDDEWVIGEVVLMNAPSSLLPVLDQYEKCGPYDPPPHEYARRVVDVLLDAGETIRAWVYVYRMDTADKPRIPSGDYLNP